MSDYRNRTVPPTSIAAIDQPLVNNLHLELKAVHEVLVSLWKGCGHPNADHIESLIAAKLNEIKEKE